MVAWFDGMDYYPQREQFLPVPTTLSTTASQRNTTSTSVSMRLAPGPMLFPQRKRVAQLANTDMSATSLRLSLSSTRGVMTSASSRGSGRLLSGRRCRTLPERG